MHKKKQKQQFNLEKQPIKDIEYLQKKLGEEKQNLVRENKKLQKSLHEEIEQNRLLKMSFEKKQQVFEQTIQQLKYEIENLKTQILLNQEDKQYEDIASEDLKSALNHCKSLSEKIVEQENQLNQNRQIIINMGNQLQSLQKDNSKYKRKIREEETEIKNLGREIEHNKLIQEQFKQECDKTVKQMESVIQQNSRLHASVENLRKKNKQFNQIVRNLEIKFEDYEKKQQQKFEQELCAIKKSRESLEEQNSKKQTSIQFLNLRISQKQSLLEAMTKELNDLKNINEANVKQNALLISNVQRIQNENRRFIIQAQKQKSKYAQQIQEIQKNNEEQLQKAKRKIAQQMSSFLKLGSDHKAIQNYMEGLKSHKSQINLRGGSTSSVKIHEQKYNAPFEKLRYENEIMNLNAEIQNLKRQNDGQLQENAKLKKAIEDKKMQLQERLSKLKEATLSYQKLQNQKNIEEQKLNKELVKLRNIETELMESKRNLAQFEEASSMKVAYYDKKIKEYIDSIDRKDSLIENLKNQKMDFENKCRFVEDKLIKSIEEVDNLRKFKNDTTRKEELLKDYKQKVQKFKSQIELLKSELDRFKKQKTRLERNLQSKQQYITVLKAKSAKEENEKQAQAKEQRNAKETQIKHQQKLKKLKKQVQEFESVLQTMRTVVADKIYETIQKDISDETGRHSEWQGAQVLGLKSNQIQQFVNPVICIDKKICQDLDQLWGSGKYEEFMRNSLEYLILKAEQQVSDPSE